MIFLAIERAYLLIALISSLSCVVPYTNSFHSNRLIRYRVNPLRTLDISLITTLEVQDYIARKRSIGKGYVPIVIVVGATEQHGPTGLIGTDYLTSLGVATKVCNECDVLLGPHLQVGMSMHHCAFPGSASFRPSTFVTMVCDLVWTLRQSSNFTHFFFINGHGGSTSQLEAIFFTQK